METINNNNGKQKKNMFKSYYVVWKLHTKKSFHQDGDCLNRTMQYGNQRKGRRRRRVLEFKSYYVVWKQKEQALWRRKVRAV